VTCGQDAGWLGVDVWRQWSHLGLYCGDVVECFRTPDDWVLTCGGSGHIWVCIVVMCVWMFQDAGWLGVDMWRQWSHLGLGSQSPRSAWWSRWCQGEVADELWGSSCCEASADRWRWTDALCCHRRWKGTWSTLTCYVCMAGLSWVHCPVG